MKTRKEFEQQLSVFNSNYRKGQPDISDVEFDGLVIQYQKLYSDSEGIDFLSSLRNSPVDKKRKERLPMKMTSLDKCKSVEEIRAWLLKQNVTRTLVIITPKFDGISLLVHESQKQCWTKGVVAEREGQRSDEHFAKLNTVPFDLFPFTIGEAIMKRSVFDAKYSKKVGGKYVHPRNMVAGLFNSSEASDMLSDVDYIRYGLPRGQYSGECKSTDALRLNVPQYGMSYEHLTEEGLSNIFYKWKKELDYDIDGLVIDINDATDRVACLDMASDNVGYAIAYKHPSWSGRVETKLLSIETKISKQGKVKPVAILEPVDIDGVTIDRVTVNNMKTVYELALYPDCSIGIKRSGDVIPKIISVHGIPVPQRDEVSDKDFKGVWSSFLGSLDEVMSLDEVAEYWNTKFLHCPCCKSSLSWDETQTELICTNRFCPDRLLAKSVYFFETLGIEDFGEPSIRQILQEFGIVRPEHILGISEEYLLDLNGWGLTSVSKLLNQFRTLNEVGVPLAKLLTALDLFEGKLAEKSCQTILDSFSESELLHLFHPSTSKEYIVQKLCTIKGVSNTTAEAFSQGFHYWLYESPEINVKVSYYSPTAIEFKSEALVGQQICFTGIRDKDVERVITENAGKVVDGVSKNTTTLVVKDLSSTSSKMMAANKLGIPIHTLDSFKAYLSQRGLIAN